MNDMSVVVPHGPDSQMLPSGSIRSTGSPSVRCASTTVAAENAWVDEVVKAALGRRTLRVSGDLDRTISTVSISAGMPGENAHIRQLESGADAVLMGEVREPEVLGYAQDMADSRGITVFLSGHTNEDAGMGVIADWLKTVFPALPVQWLPIVDPYTTPA